MMLTSIPIVFLSFNEPNYLDNFKKLLTLFPEALHVHGVRGSDTAHKEVAKTVKAHFPNATHVIIVDGDNQVREQSLDIDYELNEYTVLSFSAMNSVNNNCYGNGGVKVWPLALIETMSTHENGKEDSIDFDLSKYIELNNVASETVINGSAKQAWVSGYREGYKLTYGIEYKDINWRNYDRLWRWMHLGNDVSNGIWAVYGARLGCLAALNNFDPKNIKDHDWLSDKFLEFSEVYKDRLKDEVNRLGHLIRIKTNDKHIKDVFTPEESKQYKLDVKPVRRSQTNEQYDCVFVSYFEKNREANLERVKQKRPDVKEVSGVKGIHNAHLAAAKLCETDYFWVVDGDAELVDDFNFECDIEFNEPEAVRVWRSVNPINKLVYGNGGVKLLPRMATIRMNSNTTDMTTSISKVYKPIPIISNVTKFNTDPFNTWRSAFRECAKLASQTINNQVSDETIERLNVWCTVGVEEEYGEYAIEGAKLGMAYGKQNKDNHENLMRINDFAWLKEQYDKFH